MGETRNSALKRKNHSLEEELEAMRELFGHVQRSPPNEAYDIIARFQLYQDPSQALQPLSPPSDASAAGQMECEIERLKRRTADSGSTKRCEAERLSCFNHLFSWASCVPNQSQNGPMSNILATAPTLSTILSFPPLPLNAFAAQSEADTWTQTGWTKAHIRHVFDALLTWDCLAFCFLCKDLFLRDYESGSTQFCSSALVNAMLALACRLINETDDDDILPTGWMGSKHFFTEAKALIEDEELSESLPNIQAFGILSLYEIRCGREAEAWELAELFLSKMTELRHETRGKGQEQNDYVKSRDSSYCQSVSLIRILQLATGRVFHLPELIAPDHLPGLGNKVPCTASSPQGGGGGSLAADLHTLQPSNTQSIATGIFQLTEWVYKLIFASQVSADIKAADVSATYRQCLDWYHGFLGNANPNGNRTPFVLFIHMFYHFNLLCLFRPFISLARDDPSIRPQESCTQAAQSILALVQSYDDLFTLRHVPALMPYFICAAGLFGLAVDGNSVTMDPVHLRVGINASQLHSSEAGVYNSVDVNDSASRAPAYIKMSAAAHARLLLAKIGSNHATAKVAEKLLQEAMRDKAGQS